MNATQETPFGPPLMDEVRAWCLALPEAHMNKPFDDTVEAYRIRAKIFALLTPDPKRLNLKVDPELLPGLVAAHEAIGPGFHMNKRHWVSVDLDRIDGGTFDRSHLEDLIEDSYDLVAPHRR